mgnify:CR=1 FL=1
MDTTQKLHFENMQRTYWEKHRELENIKRLLECAKREFQNVCEHEFIKDWESRGRSSWYCQHCGKLR